MRFFKIACAFGLVFLGACGSGSNGGSLPTLDVDRGKHVSQLSDDDRSKICSWTGQAASTQAGRDCGDGVKIEPVSVEKCEQVLRSAATSCEATVGDIEDCGQALRQDPCSQGTFATCSKLASCGMAPM